jgi:sugar phosphate isomerase/epimerase
MNSRQIIGGFLCVLAVSFCAPALYAGSLDHPVTRLAVSGQEIGLIEQALNTLAMADHDYKGHRAKAMHSLEAALKELGTDVADHGSGKQTQSVSDSELRAAQRQVARAANIASAYGQTAVVDHLTHAVDEIGKALDVK